MKRVSVLHDSPRATPTAKAQVTDSRSKRILLICDYHPGLLEGLLRTLDCIGFTERVLIRKRNNSEFRDPRTRVINIPLSVFSEESAPSIPSVVSLVAYVVAATLAGTITVTKSGLKGIVGIFAFPQGLVAVLVGFLTRRRTVILTDGGDVDVFTRNPLVRPFILASLSRATAVSALNLTKANQLRSLGIRADLCPTIGVDTSRFEYFPFPGKQKGLVLYVGRLNAEKRPELLIRACNRLHLRGVRFKLLLVGDGPLRGRILDTITEMNMGEMVRLVGYVGHSETRRFFRESAIFVLPSRREGVSVSLLEAMSSGCLCVVSDIPDNRELICNMRNGVTFRVDDEEDLANKLQLALLQWSQMAHIAENARNFVETRYSLWAVGKTLMHILSRL